MNLVHFLFQFHKVLISRLLIHLTLKKKINKDFIWLEYIDNSKKFEKFLFGYDSTNRIIFSSFK